jgi:DNA-binding LytR/AlgR family response regulator
VDYLIKPVRFDRLRQAVERARRRRHERRAAALLDAAPAVAQPASHPSSHGAVIVVPDPRGERHVPVDAIIWVEAAKDYVLLHTASRSVMMRSTMAGVEDQLPASDFLRIHRSAIVSLHAIECHRRTERGSLIVVLKDGFELNVGPSYVRDVAQRLARPS